MSLKSMKLTKEEAKAEYGVCSPESDADQGPRYPYGLRICLGQEALEKLGIGLMPIDTEVMIMAKAVVVGTSSRQRQDGENSQDMDVQIVALDLGPAQAQSMEDRAKKLYPDMA